MVSHALLLQQAAPARHIPVVCYASARSEQRGGPVIHHAVFTLSQVYLQSVIAEVRAWLSSTGSQQAHSSCFYVCSRCAGPSISQPTHSHKSCTSSSGCSGARGCSFLGWYRTLALGVVLLGHLLHGGLRADEVVPPGQMKELAGPPQLVPHWGACQNMQVSGCTAWHSCHGGQRKLGPVEPEPLPKHSLAAHRHACISCGRMQRHMSIATASA